MSPESLDSMLHAWAVYYLSEFDEVSWHKISISSKIIEVGRLGIFSPGTKHQEVNYSMPEHIQIIHAAITDLPKTQQHIIKTEYADSGSQRKKAVKLNIKLNTYRSILCRAKKSLINKL